VRSGSRGGARRDSTLFTLARSSPHFVASLAGDEGGAQHGRRGSRLGLGFPRWVLAYALPSVGPPTGPDFPPFDPVRKAGARTDIALFKPARSSPPSIAQRPSVRRLRREMPIQSHRAMRLSRLSASVARAAANGSRFPPFDPVREDGVPLQVGALIATYRRAAPARCGAFAEEGRCGYGGAGQDTGAERRVVGSITRFGVRASAVAWPPTGHGSAVRSASSRVWRPRFVGRLAANRSTLPAVRSIREAGARTDDVIFSPFAMRPRVAARSPMSGAAATEAPDKTRAANGGVCATLTGGRNAENVLKLRRLFFYRASTVCFEIR